MAARCGGNFCHRKQWRSLPCSRDMHLASALPGLLVLLHFVGLAASQQLSLLQQAAMSAAELQAKNAQNDIRHSASSRTVAHDGVGTAVHRLRQHRIARSGRTGRAAVNDMASSVVAQRSDAHTAASSSRAVESSASGLSQSADALRGPWQSARDSLTTCINEVYDAKPTTWEGVLANEPPRLRALGVWWSGKLSTMPVTVAVQVSFDRLYQLEAQCRSWPGPVSAVMQIALHDEAEGGEQQQQQEAHIQTVQNTLASLVEQMDADPTMCALDILLVSELYRGEHASLLYAINALRNMARLQARTPLIIMLDVDLMVGRSTASFFSDPVSAVQVQHAVLTNKTVFVIPIFEANNKTDMVTAQELADRVSQCDRPCFLEAVAQKEVIGHDAKKFAAGQRATNASRWYNATEPYEVFFEDKWEPYFAADRVQLPWFDVSYRGYGANKAAFVEHLYFRKYKFMVLDQAFVMHRHHPRTLVSDVFYSSFVRNSEHSQRKNITDTQVEFGTKMRKHMLWQQDRCRALQKQGNYTVFLDPATINCRQKLPWWSQWRVAMRR